MTQDLSHMAALEAVREVTEQEEARAAVEDAVSSLFEDNVIAYDQETLAVDDEEHDDDSQGQKGAQKATRKSARQMARKRNKRARGVDDNDEALLASDHALLAEEAMQEEHTLIDNNNDSDGQRKQSKKITAQGNSSGVASGDDGRSRILHSNMYPLSLMLVTEVPPAPLMRVEHWATLMRARMTRLDALADAAPEPDAGEAAVDISTDGLRVLTPNETLEAFVERACSDDALRMLAERERPGTTFVSSVGDYIRTELADDVPDIEALIAQRRESTLQLAMLSNNETLVRKSMPLSTHTNYASPFIVLRRQGDSESVSESGATSSSPSPSLSSSSSSPPPSSSPPSPAPAPSSFGPGDDVIVVVSLLNRKRCSVISSTLFLGSQRLCDIKDSIDCLSDRVTPVNEACYFIIEDGVYCDERGDADAINEDVRSWIRAQNLLVPSPSYRYRSMAGARIGDLILSVGKPYAYVHQADCEHIVVFTDVRLPMLNRDTLERNAYPMRIFECKRRRRKCNICGSDHAVYVTYEDRLAPTSPCFFCSDCYVKLHYDLEGKILYEDFQVFPYYHERNAVSKPT
jgi:snRNA-activating protein complex (SNAPc), subunit 3